MYQHKSRKYWKKRPCWNNYCQYNKLLKQKKNQAIHNQQWLVTIEIAKLLASTIHIIPQSPPYVTNKWVSKNFSSTLRARIRDTWGLKNGLKYAFSMSPHGSYHLIETEIKKKHLGKFNLFKMTVLDKIPPASFYRRILGTRNPISL